MEIKNRGVILPKMTSDIHFKNFKHKNLEYISEKMTPETQDLFQKAKTLINKTQEPQILRNRLLNHTFEKTTPVKLENGNEAESYLAYAGNTSKGSLVLTNSGDIGMYYRHYDYIKKSTPNYDMNKDVQQRIKDMLD